jgi:hypothetical protein
MCAEFTDWPFAMDEYREVAKSKASTSAIPPVMPIANGANRSTMASAVPIEWQALNTTRVGGVSVVRRVLRAR